MSLTEQEIRRYSRHIILPEVGGRGQRKLKAAAVLVAGVGATGSAAAHYLAAAGIGQITLWDPEASRAQSVSLALKAINPDAQVEIAVNAEDALPGHQVVVASMGEWATLLDAAGRSGAAAIVCGTQGAGGAVTALQAGEPHAMPPLLPDEENAVAAAAGVIGTAAATEVVKLILGVGTPLFGRVLHYDGWEASFRESTLPIPPG